MTEKPLRQSTTRLVFRHKTKRGTFVLYMDTGEWNDMARLLESLGWVMKI